MVVHPPKDKTRLLELTLRADTEAGANRITRRSLAKLLGISTPTLYDRMNGSRYPVSDTAMSYAITRTEAVIRVLTEPVEGDGSVPTIEELLDAVLAAVQESADKGAGEE